MDGKKIINQLFLERGTNINEFAAKLGIKPQSLRNKLNRGSYSLTDFVEWLDLLDCDLQVITRDTQQIFK